jgi:hypothetical protein
MIPIRAAVSAAILVIFGAAVALAVVGLLG